MAELTKADIAYLQKVEARGVFKAAGYNKRRGGYTRFEGGEARARKLAERGLIKMPGFADLGRPAYAELTPAGRRALGGQHDDR